MTRIWILVLQNISTSGPWPRRSPTCSTRRRHFDFPHQQALWRNNLSNLKELDRAFGRLEIRHPQFYEPLGCVVEYQTLHRRIIGFNVGLFIEYPVLSKYLRQYLQTRKCGDAFVCSFVKNVAKGVCSIHALNICLVDLKPENLMVGSERSPDCEGNDRLYVVDTSSFLYLEDQFRGDVSEIHGPLGYSERWAAPEIKSGRYGWSGVAPPADIFSLYASLTDIVFGQPKGDADLWQAVCSESVVNKLRSFCHPEPLLRPTATAIMNDPVFSAADLNLAPTILRAIRSDHMYDIGNEADIVEHSVPSYDSKFTLQSMIMSEYEDAKEEINRIQADYMKQIQQLQQEKLATDPNALPPNPLPEPPAFPIEPSPASFPVENKARSNIKPVVPPRRLPAAEAQIAPPPENVRAECELIRELANTVERVQRTIEILKANKQHTSMIDIDFEEPRLTNMMHLIVKCDTDANGVGYIKPEAAQCRRNVAGRVLDTLRWLQLIRKVQAPPGASKSYNQ
eukprot:TRINITY_DN14047_c0_g1_i1.p1 TRINITY_DN14047_c0_g1~~TRINITY_DN14047_c0_g1_i1.p1  ORF type:complete len:510 (-),score=72.98 TRINITY_DN14047_c0_g1_i1:222-1751(-)